MIDVRSGPQVFEPSERDTSVAPLDRGQGEHDRPVQIADAVLRQDEQRVAVPLERQPLELAELDGDPDGG